ncbi:MAG TPA: DoxX family protein [Terriglobia bacterium]|nr:DoxX family protein [Terriglobia bacterium]
MNAALWAVQILLALAFITAGGMKVFAYEKYKAMSEKNGPSGLTRGLTTFISIAELAGAMGVVLPMATGVAPWLSPCAAAGLAVVMLLAIGYHLRRREPPVAPTILVALALFVALGRISRWG